jgi:hypothetical protein
MQLRRLFQFIAARLSGKRLDWALAFVALLISLLPARALAPWTSDVARVASVPIVPLMHLGMAVRDWIRPPREAFDPRSPEVVELEMQAERARTLFEQSRLKVEELDRQVAALKGARSAVRTGDVLLESARVVGIDPLRREGLVRINIGARHGVHRDAVVIIRDDVLGGLVASEPAEFVALVRPATRCTIGVRLYPDAAADAGVDARGFPGTVLKPSEGGVWLGDLASNARIAEGSIARLVDERFPGFAQGLRVGRVRRILASEAVPGARVVEVAPIVEIADEATAVVAIDPEVGAAASTGSGQAGGR